MACVAIARANLRRALLNLRAALDYGCPGSIPYRSTRPTNQKNWTASSNGNAFSNEVGLNQEAYQFNISRPFSDGRPRGPLWRGRKLIGREALFVIQGLKRLKDDPKRLGNFMKIHVSRLLKADLIAVLTELQRQGDVFLALKIYAAIKQEVWYKPDMYLFKDMIIVLARNKKMEEAMQLWEDMRKEGLQPDVQTYAEVIRGFLQYGSPSDAMNIYEEMKQSPEPPEELPFRVLLKGLLPHPLLRNKVKQDFMEIFPDRHVYDPPEEIFGMH